MQDQYVRRIIVHKIYDGDTITKSDVDLGFGSWMHNQRFRLYGINTPELRGGTEETRQSGREARDWLRARLNGSDVFVRSYKGKKGKYGRFLAELFVEGVNINQEMVRLGLATRYMDD